MAMSACDQYPLTINIARIALFPAVAQQPKGVDDAESRDMSPPQAPHILVVNDHASTRRALVAIFRRKGCRVDAVATLAEGLALLDPPPCCIILDLLLPDGGGEWILVK